MPAVAVRASSTRHVMVTAMMLPILTRCAKANVLSASRLLMPMSFAASLGTTLTLVSAPAFLLADNLLERSGSTGLAISSITPIRIALGEFGLAYTLLARWLLPKRHAKDAIGSASWWTCVVPYVELSVVAITLKQKTKIQTPTQYI